MATQSQFAGPPQVTECSKCDRQFPSYAEFHQHKVKSPRHITCEVCSMDFHTLDAKKQHHDQLHSAVQDLKCPGCLKKFDRLGGLISHIELTECQSISKGKFHEAVRGKAAWHQNSTEAHNFQASRNGHSVAGDGPNPLAKSAAGLSASSFQAIKPLPPKPVKYENDNLISFDEPSAILNSGWGQSNAPTSILNMGDFPAVGAATTREAKGKQIVPLAAVPSQATSENRAERVAAVAMGPDSAADPHDPDAPGFRIHKYWIPFMRKYKCPYLGCNKSMDKAGAFTQHLKSPAHRNEKLQCNRCLRYFNTATALTQHSEAQGVRCTIRNDANYGGIVDVITGGTATTAGRHDDHTIKYALNAKLDPATGVGAIIEANKREAEKIAKEKEDYWNKHKELLRW